MARTELLVTCVDLIHAWFINQEISVYWDNSNDWTIINNLLLDVLFVFGNTIVWYFEFFEIFCSFLALFRNFRRWAVRIVFVLDKTIDLSIIKSSWYKSFFTIFVDNLITCQRSLWRKHRMISRAKLTPSIINNRNWCNSIWWWTVTLRNNGSLTLFKLFSKIISFRNSSLFITFITNIQLFLIGSLIINQILCIDEFVIFE